MKALDRNDRLDVQYIKTDDVYDCSKLKDKTDIILLWENSPFGMPRELKGIKELEIPVISRVTDPSRAKASRSLGEKWGIDYYFNFFSESFFHSLYPENFRYKTIFYGVEKSLYVNLKPFNERIKNRILNSGNIGNDKFISKIINDLRNPKWNNYRCKVLRTKCAKLSFVDYTQTLKHNFVNDDYPLLLEKYQAAIAADTYSPVQKYWEMPAAGCLTFMEITEKNQGMHTGFKNDETSIFINESNYKEKFQEYLNDIDNKKWKEIAENGRKFALDNFNNDSGIDNLAGLMEELI